MPTELVSLLPHLTGVVEKLGTVGVLVIAVVWLVSERLRLMKELRTAYIQRDRWRLACTKYKYACDQAHITVDTSDLADLVNEGAN